MPSPDPLTWDKSSELVGQSGALGAVGRTLTESRCLRCAEDDVTRRLNSGTCNLHKVRYGG